VLRKQLELDAHFPKTGEATVQIAAFPGRSGGLVIEKRAFAEARSPLYDFLQTVQPEAGATFLLVNALGAWEAYDDNKNGDGFPEKPYKKGVRATCGHPDCTKTLDGWIAEHEVLTKHYPSFVEHGGIYRHHANKNRAKSLGDIKKAVWNTRMRRVELLLKVYNSRAGDIIERVGSDDLPAVSMGTHVKWDVCTICGHRAPTRAQYCQHAMAHLREILPDGRKVSVLNPSPRFFDISFVFRPADPTGWTLQKVARAYAVPSALAGEALDAHEAVRTRFAKTAEEIHAAWHAPTSYIGAFARLVDPATGGGAAWPQAEVYKFAADAFGLTLDDATTARLVSMTPGLVALLGDYPETFKAASDEMKNVLRQQVYEPRDELPTFGLGPGARYRAAEPPRTDILTMTDPYTGHVYQTTRGAAMAASTQDARKRLLNTALFGGLYAAGLHAGLGGALGAWSLPAGLALGAVTDHFVQRAPRPYRNPTYMTDQGVPVSGGTEFKQASVTPSAWAAKLASDGAVARATGGRFGAWASLPPGVQADQLAFGADRPGDTAYDPPSVDLNRLASNVAFILGL